MTERQLLAFACCIGLLTLTVLFCIIMMLVHLYKASQTMMCDSCHPWNEVLDERPREEANDRHLAICRVYCISAVTATIGVGALLVVAKLKGIIL